MNATVSPPWFADEDRAFCGTEPYFYDRGAFPWVAEVESQWTVVRDELARHLEAGDRLEPYVNREMTSRPERWRTLGLMFWMLPSPRNCRQFPGTWRLLSRIPNLTAASLNLLEGNATIKPHCGNTNAIIRCHLGLVVPAPAPRCAFRVGDETRGWTEGEFLLFCDAHQHTAWNNTDQKRYILVVDVMRSEFTDQARQVSARVLAAIFHEAAYQRLSWLRRYLGGPRGKALVMSVLRGYYRTVLLLRGHRG